jgi:hypothetical protein
MILDGFDDKLLFVPLLHSAWKVVESYPILSCSRHSSIVISDVIVSIFLVYSFKGSSVGA